MELPHYFIQKDSKMSHYANFTIEEWKTSMVMMANGASIRASSMICRELRRNANKYGNYSASTASRRYKTRRRM